MKVMVLDAGIRSDGWLSHDGLVNFGHNKHLHVDHGHSEFADGVRHVDGTESFRSYAKTRHACYHDVPETTFYLHLK